MEKPGLFRVYRGIILPSYMGNILNHYKYPSWSTRIQLESNKFFYFVAQLLPWFFPPNFPSVASTIIRGKSSWARPKSSVSSCLMSSEFGRFSALKLGKRVPWNHCGPVVSNTVDWRNPTNQLRLVVYPIFLIGFIHLRWLFEISSINSMFFFHPEPWGNDPSWQSYVSNGWINYQLVDRLSWGPA